jgi:hypothetical protein
MVLGWCYKKKERDANAASTEDCEGPVAIEPN